MATAIFDRIVQVQKQYRYLMQQMALSFGRTFVPRFGRVFENHPKELTRHPYLNYLRHFKIRHPKLGFNRTLQAGARAWKKLTPKEKAMYTQKEVLRRQEEQRAVQPTMHRVIRRSNRPLGFQRRTLNAEKNARNSWRHQLPQRPNVRKPLRNKIWQTRLFD